MNENMNEGAARATARRRLIRGAFAAPAALTLYSGSAFAQTSVTCVARQVNNPPMSLPTASMEPDTWVRVQLWTVGKDGKLSSWVYGADIAALKKVGTISYLSSSEWQCFTASNGSGYLIDQRLLDPIKPVAPNATLSQNGAWVAVRVAENGDIKGVVGIDGASPGGSTVAGTCWTSFKA